MNAASVTVPIRQCFGLAREDAKALGGSLNLVLQKRDGGLLVLAMDGPTALSMVVAIRADISFAPPEEAWSATGAGGMPCLEMETPDEDVAIAARFSPPLADVPPVNEADRTAVYLKSELRRARAVTVVAFGLSLFALGAVVLARFPEIFR